MCSGIIHSEHSLRSNQTHVAQVAVVYCLIYTAIVQQCCCLTTTNLHDIHTLNWDGATACRLVHFETRSMRSSLMSEITATESHGTLFPPLALANGIPNPDLHCFGHVGYTVLVLIG